MSQWIDRVNTHPIWELLKTLGVSIDSAIKREGNDSAVIDGLERVRTVLAFCGKRLASTDPYLVDPRPLNTLNAQLTSARTYIDNFVVDGVISHIDAANAAADEALVVMPSILAPISIDDLSVINESISSYRDNLEKSLKAALSVQKKLLEANNANELKIKDIETSLNAEQQKLSTLILDYQTQYSTAQDKRASEFSAVLADQQTKFAASAAEQQTQFSKDQDARLTDYAKTQLDNEAKFTALIATYTQSLNDQEKNFETALAAKDKEHQDNLETLKSNYEEAANEILEQVEAHRIEVQKLVGVIGNLGVTSGYQKVANLARNMLFIWQFVTVLALGGLIFVAFQLAFPKNTVSATIQIPESQILNASVEKGIDIGKADLTAKGKINEKPAITPSPQATIEVARPVASNLSFYQGLATRIFLSLTFIIFAAYAAKQASHFLEMERKNRKLALELEALGPYIAPLDKVKQDEFRIKVGDRSFGVPDNNIDKQKTSDSEVMSAKDLLQTLIKLVQNEKK